MARKKPWLCPSVARGHERDCVEASTLNALYPARRYEKLRRWDDALDAYHRRLAEPPTEGGESARAEAAEGCMRCLTHLGEWEQAVQLAEREW